MKQSGAVRDAVRDGLRDRGVTRMRNARSWMRMGQVIAVLAIIGTAGCYTFGGSGGFPPKLKTMAIVPFDNLTDSPEIQRELMEALRKSFNDKLNLRDASVDKADVLITGVVGRYESGLPAGVSADIRQANISRRKLSLVIDIEILNQQTGKALLSEKGMTSEGQYAEGQEVSGRKLAIETMLNTIIQRSQSQW